MSLGAIQAMLEDHLPGVYVHSLMIGNSVVEDTKNGFFLPVNDQVDMACRKIAQDDKLKNG
jgi:palmitoyl-protein thioesterase